MAKEYERHPISEKYRDMERPEMDALVQSMIEYGWRGPPAVLFEGKILDGWNRYQASKLAGIEFKMESVKGSHDEAEGMVYRDNAARRHLSPAEMAAKVGAEREARINRVAASRQEGKSIRAIAEEEEISKAQVEKDLEKAAGVHGVDTIEPKDGKVTGKDGVQQPAEKPQVPESKKVLCYQCGRNARTGTNGGKAIAGCKECANVRKQIAAEEARKKAVDAAKKKPLKGDAASTPKPSKAAKAPAAPVLDLAETVADICLELRKTSRLTTEDAAYNRALDDVERLALRRQPANKKSTKAEELSPLPIVLDTPEFRAAWSAWVQHRKEKKQSLKPSTTKLQLARLEGMGHDRAVKALLYSITQGWTGIFEEGEKKGAERNGHAKKPGPGTRYDPNFKYRRAESAAAEKSE